MYKKIKTLQGFFMAGILYLSLILVSYKVAEHTSMLQKGFVSIFDGKSLNGWEGDSTYWRVENGSIVGEITPTTLLKRNSFLIWRG